MLTILIWFIIFFFLYKFLFGFVIPVVIATKNVSAKMKDVRQNMESFETNQKPFDFNKNNPGKESTNSPNKGDYIDFEEVK